MIVRDAFVFVSIAGAAVLAGRAQHVRESGGERFYFGYGKRYLQRQDAHSLDPRQLPLADKVYVTPMMPRAFQDAGPDDYGQYLYEVLHGRKPESPLDYLVDNGQASIGALSFSRNMSPPGPSKLISTTNIPELTDAVERLEQHLPISEPMRQLLAPGTSLPGARPKALVVDDDGSQWIAKFPRENDLFSIPIAEYAAMRAASSFIDTAEVRLVTIGDRTVFLTKRFDRHGGEAQHFLSAYTLLGGDEATKETFYRNYGYPAMAGLTRSVSPAPEEDRVELYRRMALNVVLGNRDDHLKNHGYLLDGNRERYRLSPAYDIVPGAGGLVHAISLDTETCSASAQALLNAARYFRLEPDQAAGIIHQACAVGDETLRIAREQGMAEVDLQRLEGSMMEYRGDELVLRRQSGLHGIDFSGVEGLSNEHDISPEPHTPNR